MDDVFECFLNRPEVSPQEMSWVVEALEGAAAEALLGSSRGRSDVRALILRQLGAMRDEGLTHRGRVEAERLAGWLLRLAEVDGNVDGDQ